MKQVVLLLICIVSMYAQSIHTVDGREQSGSTYRETAKQQSKIDVKVKMWEEHPAFKYDSVMQRICQAARNSNNVSEQLEFMMNYIMSKYGAWQIGGFTALTQVNQGLYIELMCLDSYIAGNAAKIRKLQTGLIAGSYKCSSLLMLLFQNEELFLEELNNY
jgi:hypothetical protein